MLLGWDKSHLAVSRLRRIVSGALQRWGPSSGNPMGSMEGACGANAKSKDAEYSAEHDVEGYEQRTMCGCVCEFVFRCTYA